MNATPSTTLAVKACKPVNITVSAPQAASRIDAFNFQNGGSGPSKSRATKPPARQPSGAAYSMKRMKNTNMAVNQASAAHARPADSGDNLRFFKTPEANASAPATANNVANVVPSETLNALSKVRC